MSSVSLQSLELELANASAEFSPLELKLPESLPMQDWAELGRKLARADQVVKWWLGDWAAFGERKYGQLKEFASANGINYGTLRDAAWVSGAIPLSRRRDSLDWSFHREVAALKPREQSKWLEEASANELTRADLRRQIRLSKGESSALESDGPSIKFISRALDDLIRWLTGKPGDFWTQERKEAWRERLRPIVEFYERLGH